MVRIHELEIPDDVTHLTGHGVSVDDVEYACLYADSRVVLRDPGHGGRYMVLARDRGGRIVVVILEPIDPAGGLHRPVTAWTATRAQQAAYFWHGSE